MKVFSIIWLSLCSWQLVSAAVAVTRFTLDIYRQWWKYFAGFDLASEKPTNKLIMLKFETNSSIYSFHSLETILHWQNVDNCLISVNKWSHINLRVLHIDFRFVRFVTSSRSSLNTNLFLDSGTSGNNDTNIAVVCTSTSRILNISQRTHAAKICKFNRFLCESK